MHTTTQPSKTIIITGCSSGIGQCAAVMLKKRGYRVFATARQHKDVQALKRQGLESFYLDLNDSHSIQQAVEDMLTCSQGKIYALFNNGAYGQPGAVEDLSRTALREQFETNLFGPLELTNLIIPVMRRQGYGRIVQNSSLLGLVALVYRGAYNASKFALEGLTDTLRLELKGSGIHVSLIEPGPILSHFRANSLAYFFRHINIEQSTHHQNYQNVLARLKKKEAVAKFTLPPEAVVKKLIHALESSRPKARYYVTVPTYLLAWSKRLLPLKLLDTILSRAVSDGRS